MEHVLKIKSVDSRGECEHFIFNKYPIYTHEYDRASDKFSTNSHETDDSLLVPFSSLSFYISPVSSLTKKRKRKTCLRIVINVTADGVKGIVGVGV
jgi:hypothetical protein